MSAVSLAIRALKAQSAVTAITGTANIQPHPLKQGTALPAIAVAMSAEIEEEMLAGSSRYPESSVQLHCIASAASAAIELGETVKIALRDLLYSSADSPPVKASFVKEALDFSDFSDDLTTYRRVMGFTIRWR